MKYALVNGVKSETAPKLLGICQYCSKRMISKCGRIKLWHWAHSPKRNCDKWWEPETEWHRKWKNYFPKEYQEILHIDQNTHEKHIADIKTRDGLVIELQNSAILHEELESREKYYQKMVWIINGESYRNRFTIMDRMPSPDSIEMKDIRILTDYNENHYICYYRISENDPNPTMVLSHSYRELLPIIDKTYNGDHLFAWKNPREIWFMANKSVLLDFGGTNLYQLMRCHDGKLKYIKIMSKKIFIEKNGGNYFSSESEKKIFCKIRESKV